MARRGERWSVSGGPDPVKAGDPLEIVTVTVHDENGEAGVIGDLPEELRADIRRDIGMLHSSIIWRINRYRFHKEVEPISGDEKCSWCGKTYGEHVDAHEFTNAIPRVPCQLLKVKFLRVNVG